MGAAGLHQCNLLFPLLHDGYMSHVKCYMLYDSEDSGRGAVEWLELNVICSFRLLHFMPSRPNRPCQLYPLNTDAPITWRRKILIEWASLIFNVLWHFFWQNLILYPKIPKDGCVIAEQEALLLLAWAGCQWILIFFLRGQGSRNCGTSSQAGLIQN